MSVSLDQYIQENKNQDQVSLLIRPKKKLSTEEDSELRASLDYDLDNQIREKRSGGRSKFERTDDRSDEEEDDEYDIAPTLSIISEDVIMQDLCSSEQNCQEIESMSDDKTLRMLKRTFRTLEPKKDESQGLRKRFLSCLKQVPTQKNRISYTRQSGSIFFTYDDKNNDKITSIETRGKRLRNEAPNCNMPPPSFAVSQPPSPFPAQNPSLQIPNQTQVRFQAPISLQQTVPAPVPVYNTNGFPEQDRRNQQIIKYMDFLNNTHKVNQSLNFETRYKPSRVDAPLPNFNIPPSDFTVSQSSSSFTAQNPSLGILKHWSNIIDEFKSFMLSKAHAELQPPVVQQQAAPDPVPLYNSNCGFPVQEQRNEQNDYMEFLNNKHKVSQSFQSISRPLVNYNDTNENNFGLPSCVIPRYS